MPDESRSTKKKAPPAKPHGDELLEEVDRMAEEAVRRGHLERANEQRAAETAHQVVEAVVEGDTLPSRGLLSFYDRLRARIARGVEKRAGRFGPKAADALLLVPDVFILLVRLALDPAVPPGKRALIGGALAYFVLPADLLPEAFLGVGGFLDDLVLAAIVLSQVMSKELEPIVDRHWSGPRNVRQAIADTVASAEALLGADLYARLQAMLERRGIRR